jgi:hypothetical protein
MPEEYEPTPEEAGIPIEAIISVEAVEFTG